MRVKRPTWTAKGQAMGRNKKNNNKRSTRLYVDNKVQGALARRVILHFLMFIVVGAMIGLFLQFLSDPFRPLKDHTAAFWSQSGPHVIALLCMMPVFVKDTISLTHRMAGPIVRLRSHVRSLAAGEEVPPLKFRDGDFFTDLPPLFNEMVETLKDHGDAGDIDRLLAQAGQACNADDTVEETAAV